jgi:2-succinyl-6-hydroxy-2,4-cyclohexadiene-1-carboxylate synthase
MATISILGAGCDYELTAPTGSSTVLVFVHGWLLSRRYWEPLMQMLSAEYQCLAYDLRGFGRSPNGAVWHGATASSYSLETYATELLQLLTTLNIEKAWIIGHSLGGSIALWAAAMAPDRIEGIVGLNAGGGIYLQEAFEQFRNAGQQMVKLRPSWLRHLPLLDRAFANMATTQTLDRAWGQQRLVDFLDADAVAAQELLLASTTRSQVHQLPQIVAALPQPAYFIAGSQDKVMEPRYVRHLASFHRAFPEWGGNVLEVPECGHFAMLEQTDTIAKYLQSVLQGQAVPACV